MTRPKSAIAETVRKALVNWRETQALGDCPLPELLRRVRAAKPRTTLGQFHDALRRLSEDRVVALHPWTGPLYEIPEPAAALLAGHEIAYYADLCEPSSP